MTKSYSIYVWEELVFITAPRSSHPLTHYFTLQLLPLFILPMFSYTRLWDITYPHLSRLLHWTLEWAFPCKTVVRNNKSTFYQVESRKEKVNYPDSHLDSPLSNFTAGRGASLLVGSQPTTAAVQIEIVDNSDCCRGSSWHWGSCTRYHDFSGIILIKQHVTVTQCLDRVRQSIYVKYSNKCVCWIVLADLYMGFQKMLPNHAVENDGWINFEINLCKIRFVYSRFSYHGNPSKEDLLCMVMYARRKN